MKKLILLAMVVLLAYTGKTYAQDVNAVFSAKEIVWFGADFSNVKFVGNAADFANLPDIRNRILNSINALFVSEPDKYNVKKAFKKDKVITDLSVNDKRNLTLDIDKVLVDTEQTLSKETIQAMIKEYTPKEATTGIGGCFVMENLVKKEKDPYASLYVVFFDIATKNVLICEKTSAKAGGIGFRNFWAKTVFLTIDDFSMPALEKKYKK